MVKNIRHKKLEESRVALPLTKGKIRCLTLSNLFTLRFNAVGMFLCGHVYKMLKYQLLSLYFSRLVKK